jgi:hypothetical protein
MELIWDGEIFLEVTSAEAKKLIAQGKAQPANVGGNHLLDRSHMSGYKTREMKPTKPRKTPKK